MATYLNMKKTAFDANLGGTVKLPEYLNVMKFAQSRAKEVKAMCNLLSQKTGTKLIFQRLPKHMRRRTMSHHVKRLPQRLREAHLHQLEKSGMPPKSKRPSRKFRRKPTNLLQAYNFRERNHAWLETHIWHAKRFHMIERWGYRLPLQPCDKAFRACYRASAKHCLIQDISYYCCIEINGLQNILLEGFNNMTVPGTGLSVGAKAFLYSQREGSTIFFNKVSNSFKAIGEVKFIWKPLEDSKFRCIWLWVHPAFYSELLTVLKHVFKLAEMSSDTKVHNINYYNVTNDTRMTELKHNLNRFRLTGPNAHAIIQNALKVPLTNNKCPWYNSYLNLDENRQIFHDQCIFWKSLQHLESPTELSPHVVVNLIIIDPRYNFPNKRIKAVPNTKKNCDLLDITPNVKYGQIWNSEIRSYVSEMKQSTTHFLNERRNLLVPEDSTSDEALVIPVMLIQLPGVQQSSDCLGYCSGWDIIIPSGWGLPLWLCLIMWGARAGGLREAELLQFEMGKYDILPPDTMAGETEECNVSNKYKEKYFRLPPAKRINYTKIGICSPFILAWKKIIGEWNNTGKPVQEFYVLRNGLKLNKLQELLSNKTTNVGDVKQVDINYSANCIVPVRLNLLGKGVAKKFSIICLAQDGDLKGASPVEPLQEDLNKPIRNKLRNAHKILLKRLRQRRIRVKQEGKVFQHSNNEVIKAQAAKMRALWLPEPKKKISASCSRQVIGFVTNGDFSFTTGKSRSIGYIAVGVLPTLLNTLQKEIVLVRDISSRQYRLAKIEIIC